MVYHMRLALGILAALLLGSAAHGQTFPGLMPPATIVCNNTASSANPTNCTYIVTSVTGGIAGTPVSTPGSGWFANDSPPAKISKFGDRVFIGDAVKYAATTPPPSGGDWYNTYSCARSACGVYGGGATLLVETSATNAAGTLAIVGAASSQPCLGRNCGFIGLVGIGINDVAPTAGKTYNGWGLYAECNNVVNNTGACVGAEIDVGFEFDRDAIFGNIPANNPFQPGGANAIQSTCGTSYGSVTYYVCDTWLQLQSGAGNSKFVTGINFGQDSIMAGRGPQIGPIVGTNATVAVAMPETYMLTWWSDVNTIAGAVWTGAAGVLNFAGTDLAMNGVFGVDCPAGTVNAATMVVTKGLVTHC